MGERGRLSAALPTMSSSWRILFGGRWRGRDVCVESPIASQTLELMNAAVVEPEIRPTREVHGDLRRENLVGRRSAHHACRLVYGQPSYRRPEDVNLTNMDPCPHVQPQGGGIADDRRCTS